MEFIEASAFTKHVYKYLSDAEFLGLQSFLLEYPEAGNIVPGSGGVRKVRWAIAGKGKSHAMTLSLSTEWFSEIREPDGSRRFIPPSSGNTDAF